MSRTYSLICEACKVSLWAGQKCAGSNRAYLYTHGKDGDALNAFMFSHEGHQLKFLEDQKFDPDEYRELSEKLQGE